MNNLTTPQVEELLRNFENEYLAHRNVDNKENLKNELDFMKTFITIKYIYL